MEQEINDLGNWSINRLSIKSKQAMKGHVFNQNYQLIEKRIADLNKIEKNR